MRKLNRLTFFFIWQSNLAVSWQHWVIQAQDLLKALGNLKINLNILTTTRIGMTVNALRETKTITSTESKFS
jgi:hypothetical protein